MQVIISTHAEMADGIQATTEFIMGKQDNLHAFPAYTPGNEDFLSRIKSFINDHSNEAIIVFTDIIGGSVNTELTQLLPEHPNLYLIAGVNLPMVIQALMTTGKIDVQTLHKIIETGKSSITLVNEQLRASSNEFSEF